MGTGCSGDGRGGGICCGAVHFSALPEGCVANIISFTSPLDACRMSLVSSLFRSAAESDAVWKSFLPSGYQTVVSSSTSPSLASFASKKELYFHLCDNPILIDGGKKSFSLDKRTGKICYMISPRDLYIVWGDTPRYWTWSSPPGVRFPEVAELISVCWLEIRGKINTRILSPLTSYAAYIIFKPTNGSYGFQYQPVEVSFGLVGTGSNKRTVYLDTERGWRQRSQIMPRRLGLFNRTRGRISGLQESRTSESNNGQFPKERDDGWLEIELGEFLNKGDDIGEVEMSVLEVKGGDWKGGLIVQGIEIRPKVSHR